MNNNYNYNDKNNNFNHQLTIFRQFNKCALDLIIIITKKKAYIY